MTQHTTNFNTLQKRIMHRVYYTFAIRIATHPIVTHAVVLGLSTVIFAKLVYVAAVYRNIMQVQVGELASYIMYVIVHADIATLLVVALMIATVLSFRWRIKATYLHHLQSV